jgi:hypothetical protein
MDRNEQIDEPIELRRRRWLTPAQGWNAVTTLGSQLNKFIRTLKGFVGRRTLSGFNRLSFVSPGFSLRSNPGLGLANAFGVLIRNQFCLPLSPCKGSSADVISATEIFGPD